jgi:hypothetical protein
MSSASSASAARCRFKIASDVSSSFRTSNGDADW